MTKEQVLAKRKAEGLKQERRDFLDAYTEEWESEGWIEEWEAQEQELLDQWHGQPPDGSEKDWDEWLNRQMIVWQVERREAVWEEAQGKWSEQEAEYERQWEADVRKNAGDSLRAEKREESKSSIN